MKKLCLFIIVWGIAYCCISCDSDNAVSGIDGDSGGVELEEDIMESDDDEPSGSESEGDDEPEAEYEVEETDYFDGDEEYGDELSEEDVSDIDYAACYAADVKTPRLAPKYPGTWQALHPYPIAPFDNDFNPYAWSALRKNTMFSARFIEDDGELAIMGGQFPLIFDGEHWVRSGKPVRLPALITPENSIPYCDRPGPSDNYLSLFDILRNGYQTEHFYNLTPFADGMLLITGIRTPRFFFFDSLRWRQLVATGPDGVMHGYYGSQVQYNGLSLVPSGTFQNTGDEYVGSYGTATIFGNELRLSHRQVADPSETVYRDILAAQLLTLFTVGDELYATGWWGKVYRYNEDQEIWDTVYELAPYGEDHHGIPLYPYYDTHATFPDGRVLLFGSSNGALEIDTSGIREIPFQNPDDKFMSTIRSVHIIDNDTALLLGQRYVSSSEGLPLMARYEQGTITIWDETLPVDTYELSSLRVLAIDELPGGEPVGLAASLSGGGDCPFWNPGNFSGIPPFLFGYIDCGWITVDLPDIGEIRAEQNAVTGMAVWNAANTIAVASREGLLLLRNFAQVRKASDAAAEAQGNWELLFPDVWGIRDVAVDQWDRLCMITDYGGLNGVACMDSNYQITVVAPPRSMERLVRFNKTDYGVYILGEGSDALYRVEYAAVSKVALDSIPESCRTIFQVDRRTDGRGLLVPEKGDPADGYCNGIGMWHGDDTITFEPYRPGDALDTLRQSSEFDKVHPAGVMLEDGTPYMMAQGGGYVPKADGGGWRWESQIYEGVSNAHICGHSQLVRKGNHIYALGTWYGMIMERHLASRETVDTLSECADTSMAHWPEWVNPCEPGTAPQPVDCDGSQCPIPGGSYCLGDLRTILVAVDDFSIDKYEVSNSEYRQCVQAGICEAPRETYAWPIENYYGNPGYDSFPVVNVDGFQAQEYCRWAGGRLPTEFEWEIAAGGGGDTYYPWGEYEPGPVSLSWANVGHALGHMQAVDAAPDGKSPFGVEQMVGNAAEWTMSTYPGHWQNCMGGCEQTIGDIADYEWVILRGGSWGGGERYPSSYHRLRFEMNAPDVYSSLYGFRCVYDNLIELP